MTVPAARSRQRKAATEPAMHPEAHAGLPQRASTSVRPLRRHEPIGQRVEGCTQGYTVTRAGSVDEDATIRRKERRRGTISRILYPVPPANGPAPGDDHSSSPAIAGGVEQPTRRLRTGRPRAPPYSVLLRAGFSLPSALRRTRCALTAPFHPYPSTPRRTGPSRGGMFSVPLSFRSP